MSVMHAMLNPDAACTHQ